MELEPKSLEFIQTGATAALLLDAQRLLVTEQVELVLKKIDHAVKNGLMDPTLAVGCVNQIAAFRSILHSQSQKVEQGRLAARRLAEVT